MDPAKFIDYYELLQVSSNADADTIQRVFRHLAKKYHPDHNEAPNEEVFRRLVEAHTVLTDPAARAGYDADYQDYWNRKWRLVSESGDSAAFNDDREMRDRMLSLFYVQRRRSMASPGLGEYEIARLLQRPVELVEFHLWYLRSKGWIERLESGMLAISASGVDQVEQSQLKLGRERLIEAHSTASKATDADAAGNEQPAPAEIEDRTRPD